VRAFNEWLNRGEDFIVGFALALATIATFVEVIARYVFSASVGTGGELAVFSIIWAAMIGAAVAARSGVHIGVDVLVKRLPAALAKGMVLLSLLVGAIFTFVVTLLGIQLVQLSFETGQVTNELLIPRWPLYASVPLGMALMTYHLLQQFVAHLRKPAEDVVAGVGAEEAHAAQAEAETVGEHIEVRQT